MKPKGTYFSTKLNPLKGGRLLNASELDQAMCQKRSLLQKRDENLVSSQTANARSSFLDLDLVNPSLDFPMQFNFGSTYASSVTIMFNDDFILNELKSPVNHHVP